jgi:hypothetical protein
MFMCPILSCLLTFPLAALIGLFFRFPVPFAGYLSRPDAIVPSMVAVLLYSCSWFGVLQAAFVLGAIAGAFRPGGAFGNSYIPTKYDFIASSVAALIPILVLSVLDKFVGPW